MYTAARPWIATSIRVLSGFPGRSMKPRVATELALGEIIAWARAGARSAHGLSAIGHCSLALRTL